MVVADALSLVLEADTSNYETNMKKAEQETQDLRKEQDSLAFQNSVTLASFEALTSGLNGIVGGYSKTINAANDLNIVNEKQYESLLRSQKQLELLVGPLELVISGFKIFNAVLLMNPLILLAVAIVALVALLVYLEVTTGAVTETFTLMHQAILLMIRPVTDLQDAFEGLQTKFENLTNIGDRVSGYVGSIT